MTIEQIRQLVADLTNAGLSGADIDKPGFRLSVKRANAADVQAENVAAKHRLQGSELKSPALEIKSNGVGCLLDTHPDTGTVLAPLGSDVQCGQLVAFLAVDTLLLPIRSPYAGRVRALLVPIDTVVGFGEPLISLSPYDNEVDHA